MGLLRRLDLIVLALMLVYVVVVFIRVSHRCRKIRPTGESATDTRTLKNLFATVSAQLINLKSIASIAPYLGLIGTCIGIFDPFGYLASWRRLAADLSAAPLTAGAGILVAVSATCIHNYLRPRLDFLESEMPDRGSAKAGLQFRSARRFPLAKRISCVPTFALIAATCVVFAIAGYMILNSFYVSTGLDVKLAPIRCELEGDDRLIVMRVTNAGEVFINSEQQQDWKGLAVRLSQIYAGRNYRRLYLLAENGVPFQKAADAIDRVQNSRAPDTAEPLDIRVVLVTPASMEAKCLEPVSVRLRRSSHR